MNETKVVSRAAATGAVLVAALADLAQVPLTLANLSIIAAVPAETIDLVVDCVAAIVIIRLLGFHWSLLPTFAIELLPIAELAPTWVACSYLILSSREVD